MEPAGEGTAILDSDLKRVKLIGWNDEAILLGHLETRRRVAAPAVLERQVAAKRTLAVVTREAGLAASPNEVLDGRRRTYLATLCCPGRQRMTVVAGQPLCAAVLCVAESKAKGARIRARTGVRFLVMANSARGNFFSGWRRAGWRVAGVTLVVGGDARRNSQGRRASAAAVTCGTATLGPR